MLRPEFDSIKDYDQFKKYSWSRTELIDICKEHGLSLKFDFVLFGVSLIFTVIGIINKINYAESVDFVLFFVFGVTGLFVAFVSLNFSLTY